MDLAAVFQRLATVDYLDGLGLALSARELSFVHVAKRFFRVSVCHIQTVPLPESGRERLEAFGAALTQFLQDIEVTPDQVVLCLPRRVACVSRLVVPETARGSLGQVISYEMERLLPFSQEEIYYDYLTYPVGGEEGRLGVVIFCLPRREVEDHLDVLTQAQVHPRMVTLSSSAQISTLRFCGSVTEAPCVLIAQEDGKLELSFVEKKQLVASHLFSLDQVREQTALTDLVAQGIARNLPGASPAETPLFAWGINGALPLVIDADHDLAALVNTRFSLDTTDPFPPAALTALGAALQAVGETGAEINLLPIEKRAQREKPLSVLTLVLVGLVFLLGVVWATGVVVQGRRMLDSLEQQVQALSPAVRQVQAQEEEAAHLSQQLQILNDTTQKRVVPLLKDLSELIPPDIYLASFRYRDGKVELSGVAATSASDLIAMLEGSPCLRNVASKAPFTKTSQGETFTLDAQVDPCG